VAILDGLSKREREIVGIVFRLREVTAREVQYALEDGTSYSAVRTFLAALEEKGLISHRLDGQRYLWYPTVAPEMAGASLIAEATENFFRGSRERAIAALIETDQRPLSEEEYQRLKSLIEQARVKGR